MSELQQFSVLSEVRSNRIILPQTEEIETQLSLKINEMTDCQKCGNYVKAEKCKQNIEQLKKQLHEKQQQGLTLRHRRQKRKMEKTQAQEIAQRTTFWDQKMTEHILETQKLQSEMQTKHQGQMSSARTQLQAEIPNKLKQSSECLNLRKMQEQMAKQKKYTEAHKVQQKVIQMQKQEKETFEKQRQVKIQTALTTLKCKHKTQRQALMKKIKANESELSQNRQTQLQRVKHKNINCMKELKSQQEKQVLCQKGQFKSKAALTSVTSRSKLFASTSASKLFVSTSPSKLLCSKIN